MANRRLAEHSLTLCRTHDGEQRNIAVDQLEDKRQTWLNVVQHFIDCILDSVECQAPLCHGLEVQRMMVRPPGECSNRQACLLPGVARVQAAKPGSVRLCRQRL